MTALADQLWEDAGAPTIEEFFGTTITFSRRSETSGDITAVGDTINYTLLDAQGATTVVTGRDYTIPVASVVVSGSTLEPKKGDLIREVIGGETHVYEVQPIGDKPAVQLLAGGFRWLVRTKRIG
jgi:hypothetical protein